MTRTTASSSPTTSSKFISVTRHYRHTEFFRRIRDLNPEYLIIDSHVVPGVRQPFVKLRLDKPQKQGDAILDQYSHGGNTLVALPSVPAINVMLRAYNFGIEHVYDWDAVLNAHPDVERMGDYAKHWRVTMRCRSGLPADEAVDPAETPQSGVARSAPARSGARVRRGQDGSAPPGRRGWRSVVNTAVGKATGYEFRRMPSQPGR